MSHKWEKAQDNESYALRVDDVVKGFVFFIGGHVERPDTWYAKLDRDKDSVGYETLDDAKRYVEEELGLRTTVFIPSGPMISATIQGPTQVINKVLGERGPLSLPELVKACRPLPEVVVRSDAQRMLEAGALVLGLDMKVSPSEKEDPQDEIVMYIVARQDLKMSPGKLAAQVGHGVQFVSNEIKFQPPNQLGGPKPHGWFNAWNSNGSSTKIVLAVNSEAELLKLEVKVPLCRALVRDEGRTEIEPSYTVLAFAPTPKSIAKKWLSHLPRYR